MATSSETASAAPAKKWRTLTTRQYARMTQDPAFTAYEHPPIGESLTVHAQDGTRIHAEVYGPPHAPPIVLSHGIACAIPFWTHQIAALSNNFRVIAYDHRGHGRSDAPRARTSYTLEHLGDDLDAVLQATVRPDERAILAGHSMGGFAIASWAARHPESVQQCVGAVALMNTATGELIGQTRLLPTPPWMNSARGRLALMALPFSGLPLPARTPLRRHATARIAVAATTPPATVAHIQEMIFTTPAHGRGGFAAALLRLGTTHLSVSDLQVPTTVIASTEDLLTPPSHAKTLAGELPHLHELQIIPGGHCSPLEQPDLITAALHNLADKYGHGSAPTNTSEHTTPRPPAARE
ncbi:alpha/beta fold hydrolase [Rhodococcus erythropolis]|uniref:alpha/beta fold hydrolase n=1 Tax=Rhodococcus erythropolis TaxID=1833 RepID=UPI001BEC8FF6|nr:alpha/beta fold hydrolase [Rhodococcus erythropolis]MBT2269603.1 alpha/beta fold hydrolase [Rhodococcus erythropolis]